MERAEAPDDVGGVDADNLAVREEGLEDVGCLVVGKAAVSGENNFPVGDVEIGVGGRKSLIVVEDDVRHREFDDGGLLAVGKATTVEHLEVFLKGLIVLVPSILLYGGDDGVGCDKAREVVDVAVGVVTHDAVAQPDDVVHTIVVAKITFYLILRELRISVGIEEARGGGEEVATAVDIDATALHDDIRFKKGDWVTG